MERVMKSIGAILFTMLAVAALSTCVNPFDWVARVSDEVMQAKDLYLQVTGVTPVNNETAFSPDDPILIEFDRDIDPASVTATTVVFSPSATWTSSYDAGTNTLRIIPDLLAENADYQLTVTEGVLGMDESALRDPYVWNFHATVAPTGSVKINNDAAYTTSTSVTLNITASSVVTQMRYSQTEFLADDNSLPWGSVAASIASYSLSAGNGSRTVYIQFRDNPTDDRRSSVKFDAIFLDTSSPSVTSLGSEPSYFTTSTWTSNAAVTEVGSGIASYSWTQEGGSGGIVSFGTPGSLNTTVTGTANGTRYIRLTVTDYSGRTGTRLSSLITVDITPPSTPSFTGPTSPGIDPTFTWTSGGGGNGTYRWNVNGGTWYTVTGTSCTPSTAVFPFGSNTIYLQERDAAGNWSSSAGKTFFRYPDFLLPPHAATGVSVTPTIRYASSNSSGYTFRIYAGSTSKGPWEPVETTTAISFVSDRLPYSTKIYWYYTVTSYKTTLYESPVYWFTTKPLF